MAGVKTGISGQINNNIVTDGLVFYIDPAYKSSYTGTGTTLTDLEGSNNLTLINGPTFNSSGNGSINFDGPSDYAETESNIGISSNDSRTFEGWYYIDDTTDKNIAGYGSTQGGKLFDTLIWNNNGYVNVIGHYYGGGNDTISTLPSRNTINVNQWNQIVHLYDGSDVSIYTNGEFSNSKTLSLNTTNSKLRIAAGHYAGAYNYFLGKGSTFKIYNRALSAGEVLQNYQAQKERFGL